MKAQELQLGDWVNIYTFPDDNPKMEDLFPAKITGILYDGTIECSYNTIEDGVGYASRPADTCLPILLTPEILEKNEFEQNWWWRLKGQDLWLSNSGDEYRVYADGDCDKRDNFCWIKYVHELQHVYHLLKIEKEIVL